jgi:RNA polymerase sigma factor (sigma-70 family)
MVSLVLDGGRRRVRRTLELSTSPPESGAQADVETASSTDARTDLIRALGELPARRRTVLVLRYFSDLPEAEVATILDCSLGTVKSSTSRALEQLRQTLEESETPPPETARRTAR